MAGYVGLQERLIERGLVSAEDMARVANLRKDRGASLPRLLVELGFIAEDDLLPLLSEQLKIPLVSLKDFPLTPLPVESLLNAAEFFKHAALVPLGVEDNNLLIATTDPTDFGRLHALEVAGGLKVRPVLAKEKEIQARIETLFGNGEAGAGASEFGRAGPFEGSADEQEIEHLRDMASEAPVIRLVNQVLARALESRSSDVHIEPFESQLKVRYRIDGILHEIDSPPRQLSAAIISRLKILAQLNIAERRLPQDGRIKTRIGGKDVDLRIATIPTLYGESVVIRLLERSQIFTDLESLGFPGEVLGRFAEMISKPHGMVLVTGPTGSGKTTTLYAALQKINDPGKKIITIEDPVEYQLSGVNQIQVKPQIGLSFASGLRSIVRQDPDVIMVGEIRDYETAEIAVQAALTGHLVFSTLHTNDAAGAVSRLLEMGVQDYLLSSSLLGVLAQRLVRRLCGKCRRRVAFGGARGSGFEGRVPEWVWEAGGCEECAGTGYRGRVGIFELLRATPGVCNLIVEKADAARIRASAVSEGMKLLRQDGEQKIRDGVTSIAEVLRVTREEG